MVSCCLRLRKSSRIPLFWSVRSEDEEEEEEEADSSFIICKRNKSKKLSFVCTLIFFLSLLASMLFFLCYSCLHSLPHVQIVSVTTDKNFLYYFFFLPLLKKFGLIRFTLNIYHSNYIVKSII